MIVRRMDGCSVVIILCLSLKKGKVEDDDDGWTRNVANTIRNGCDSPNRINIIEVCGRNNSANGIPIGAEAVV